MGAPELNKDFIAALLNFARVQTTIPIRFTNQYITGYCKFTISINVLQM
jgi:hypothetical protein